MAKSFIYNRVRFPTSEQKSFLLAAERAASLKGREVAKKLGISVRTYSDWKREKNLMSESALRVLCKIGNLERPQNIEILSRYWYVHKGARKGALARLAKYGPISGNSAHRKALWQKWWETKGRFIKKNILAPQEIHIPKQNSDLAEFIGILLGDGGIRTYQVTITLHLKDDFEYSTFVSNLIERLFGFKPRSRTRPEDSTIVLFLNRVKVIKFLEKQGLHIGNKVKLQVDVPEWIRLSPPYLQACIRGLMDTDGCIYTERHSIKDKQYSYPRLAFVNHSIPLRNSVFLGLSQLGLDPRHRNNRSVHLERKSDILRYFAEIGTNNPKHDSRFENCFERRGVRVVYGDSLENY